MPLIGGLTRPEDCTQRAQLRRLRELLDAKGGCVLCIHRDPDVLAWGRSVCKAAHRRWPGCATDNNTPAFALDEDQLRGMR